MGDYEADQKQLQKLWEEVMSADEDECDFSSDDSEYEPEDTDTSDSDQSIPKRKSIAEIIKSPCIKRVKRIVKIGTNDSSNFNRNLQVEEPQPSTSTCSSNTSTSNNDAQNIDDLIESVIAQNIDYEYDDENINNSLQTENGVLTWGPVTGNYIQNISFRLNDTGILPHIYDHFQKTPYDFYKMVITDDIIQLFVDETNMYAQQEQNKGTTPRRARI